MQAGLTVFAEQGFAATKLDDVAVKAGVAKGTIYLYFRDKQDLFEQLLQSLIAPVLDGLEALAARDDISPHILVRQILERMRAELLGTRRKDILRLIIAEGPRFPEIARFHHDRVVSRGIGILRRVLERAAERGEIASSAYARFPQLVMAPVVVAVIWDSLFGGFDPLDAEAMLAAHLDVILGDARTAS